MLRGCRTRAATRQQRLHQCRGPLIDPSYLAAREAQLRAEYRPGTWGDCVRALIGALDETVVEDAQAVSQLCGGLLANRLSVFIHADARLGAALTSIDASNLLRFPYRAVATA